MKPICFNILESNKVQIKKNNKHFQADHRWPSIVPIKIDKFEVEPNWIIMNNDE